jgi:hypothetical protein
MQSETQSRVVGLQEKLRTRSQRLTPPSALRLSPTLCFNKFGSLAALSPTLISAESVIRLKRPHDFLKRKLFMTLSLCPLQMRHEKVVLRAISFFSFYVVRAEPFASGLASVNVILDCQS